MADAMATFEFSSKMSGMGRAGPGFDRAKGRVRALSVRATAARAQLSSPMLLAGDPILPPRLFGLPPLLLLVFVFVLRYADPMERTRFCMARAGTPSGVVNPPSGLKLLVSNAALGDATPGVPKGLPEDCGPRKTSKARLALRPLCDGRAGADRW